MKKILVVGSLNMDLVTVCKKAAIGGETIFGKDFLIHLEERELIKQLQFQKWVLIHIC